MAGIFRPAKEDEWADNDVVDCARTSQIKLSVLEWVQEWIYVTCMNINDAIDIAVVLPHLSLQ